MNNLHPIFANILKPFAPPPMNPNTTRADVKQKRTKAVTVQFRGAPLTLPEGLRVEPVKHYPTQTRPQYWLAEFPEKLFPFGSIIRHDATHYGIWLEESDVQS